MPIASHSDIAKFFEDEVARIKREIDRVETGLALFTGSKSEGTKTQTQKAAKSSQRKTSGQGKTGESKTSKKLQVPVAYDKSLTWDKKILFVLKELGSAFTYDIIESVKSHEPEIDSQKADHIIPQRVSALAGKGHIKVTNKEGRRRKYSL